MSILTTHPLRPMQELVDLSGQTAVITGGAMGIGRGIADRLHEAGAAVVLADLDADTAAAYARELNERRGASAVGTRTDVSQAADVATMVELAVDRFGSVDILVNNAGIYPLASLAEIDLTTFRRVVDVNLIGLYLCTQAGSRQMIAQGGGGKIINVTSIDALHPSAIGLAHYDASKHGAWGFTKNVALELAQHHIRVNAIAPGGVATPGTGMAGATASDELAELTGEMTARIPMGRFGDADEIGRVALFLASELSSYMTGAQVVVDGGVLLR
jgi:2-dehydro-3-deoxy-D-gluconate 5-dehydrogenase